MEYRRIGFICSSEYCPIFHKHRKLPLTFGCRLSDALSKNRHSHSLVDLPPRKSYLTFYLDSSSTRWKPLNSARSDVDIALLVPWWILRRWVVLMMRVKTSNGIATPITPLWSRWILTRDWGGEFSRIQGSKQTWFLGSPHSEWEDLQTLRSRGSKSFPVWKRWCRNRTGR